MAKLFENTVRENRKYVDMVNSNDDRQVEQLAVCKVFMDKIIELGLANEYREFCEAARA